jgi:hypothetical protein
VGQDLVYLLSEKFPEEIKIRQIVSQRSSLLEASFLEKWVAIHYFKGAQEGRASWSLSL